jgi:hypothetical protein
MSLRPGLRPAFLILALAAWPGCGGATDDLPREPVYGSVTFEDKPVASGMIQFLPASPEAGTQAGAKIENGSYSVPREGGPVPGKYQVVINASSGDAASPSGAPGKAAPVPKEIIPAKYNTRSELTAEVKKGGGNRFDFELKKK